MSVAARLSRLEARSPRNPETPAQLRAMLAVVSDPDALAMAERLRVIRAARGRALTDEELCAVPGMAALTTRLRAQHPEGRP